MTAREAREAIMAEWQTPHWEQSTKRFESRLDAYSEAIRREAAERALGLEPAK